MHKMTPLTLMEGQEDGSHGDQIMYRGHHHYWPGLIPISLPLKHGSNVVGWFILQRQMFLNNIKIIYMLYLTS